MKPLLPTLKERQRYVVYEVITAHKATGDLSGHVLSRLSQTLGTLGMARAGVLSIMYHEPTQTGMLRCNHDMLADLRTALVMGTHLGRQQVLIRTLGVSGMIDKARRFLPKEAWEFDKKQTKGLRGNHASDATPDDGV